MDNCSSDYNDCKMKMKKVLFMTIHKSAGFFEMNYKIQHFDQGLYAYLGTNFPHEVLNADYHIIYFDTSKLFPTLDKSINCSDFTKIFLDRPQ